MELEATMPHGVAPGGVFMAETPAGLMPVMLPAGSLPGQKVRFTAPPVSNSGAPAPVLLGTAAPYQAPQAQPMSPIDHQGYRYVPGCVYRIDPFQTKAGNVPMLQGIPVEKADRKCHEIRKGAELARDVPAFPERRRCRDVLFIVPFLLVLGGMIAASYTRRLESTAETKVETSGEGWQVWKLRDLIAPSIVGGAASLLAAVGYVLLARFAPGCIVWTSLLFSPALMILGGLALLSAGSTILGLICEAMGIIFLTCVFTRWSRSIPFMKALLKAVAIVIKANLSMMVTVSLLGSLTGLGWALACGIVFSGAFDAFRDNDNIEENANQGSFWCLMFVACVIFAWGVQVAQNVCHVTYCGVFGRWYFKADDRAPLRRSLGVALTTSFGSICFGSLLIEAVRALEATLRVARRHAMKEDGTVCCLVLCVLGCVIECIGDILEYFSEWAYVQCAVRGVSFIDGARITYAMMTCTNMGYVLQDLLINSVVSLGTLLCGVVGCAAGALAGLHVAKGIPVYASGIIGLLAGLMAGGLAAGVISSGAKTMLALWAEDPEPLRASQPAIHEELERKITARLFAEHVREEK